MKETDRDIKEILAKHLVDFDFIFYIRNKLLNIRLEYKEYCHKYKFFFV